MKVVLDGTGIANYPTGVGVYATQLIKALCDADVQTDFSVLISNQLNESNSIFKMKYSNLRLIPVSALPIGPKRDWLFNGYKQKYLTGAVYHCLSSNFPRTIRPIRNGIVTIHDLKYVLNPGFLGNHNKVKSFYLRSIFRNAVNNSDQIICDSYSTEKDLLAFFGNKISSLERKIKVIHLADSLGRLLNSKTNPVVKYGITKPFFLYVGEWRPHKNITGLLDAFTKFLSRNSFSEKYSLVLVGPKHRSFDINTQSQIPQYFRNRIHTIENIPDDELKSLYHESFAVVLVSFYEGFGLPVVEAMQAGKPVIVSNISSLPELVGDSKWTVDPNDTEDIIQMMARLAQDSEFYRAAEKNSLERRTHFSWEFTAKMTLEIYRNVYRSI